MQNVFEAVELVKNTSHDPLELDFVYGYIEAEKFIPLDGQQRLTTIYLIHWYYAFKEEQLEKYKVQFSRFNYQIRQSSSDFLKKINSSLTSNDYKEIFLNGRSFEDVLKNKNWYYIVWNHDLTIQSMITMLDEIHSFDKKFQVSFFDLISESKPSLVFYFTDVEVLGLSDDLYIKMNARGKPLTEFENLKAELGRIIEKSGFNYNYDYSLKQLSGLKAVDVKTYFSTQIDTSWSDYFWKQRDEDNQFDKKMLNLLFYISLFSVVKGDYKRFDFTMEYIQKNNSNLTFYQFKGLDLLDEETIIYYINLLDLLVSTQNVILNYLNSTKYFNKQALIYNAFESNYSSRYLQRTQFYAISKFVIKNQFIVENIELKNWDRLVRNLTENTIYNSAKDFRDSIIAIDVLIDNYRSDVQTTFLSNDITGFDGQQILEEKIKIILLNKGAHWVELIETAEGHNYLNGQIMFILAYSGVYDYYRNHSHLDWDNEKELEYYDRAKGYYEKFTLLFSETGLRHFDNELFRRALLSIDDYLLYSSNFSFLVDNHRDISWKRLLRESGNRKDSSYIKKSNCMKTLFDQLEENDLEGSLHRIITSNNVLGWRKDFIENPDLIIKSTAKYIKYFNENRIYVLSTSKYNKYNDFEVQSYLLKKGLVSRGYNHDDIQSQFIEELNQYGIVRIKNHKVRICYNVNGSNKFVFIKEDDTKEEFNDRECLAIYITESFL